MVVKLSFAGAQGFDINRPLSGGEYVALKSSGMDFAFRYVPLNAADAAGHITNAELNAILAAGLAVLLVQNVDSPPWSPTAELGTSHGSYAVSYAKAIEYPAGGPIYCDMESPAKSATPADCLAYINAWVKEVQDGGFEPCLYCGWGLPLTSTQLFDIPVVKRYWRAYNGPEVATRGYSMIQHTQKTLNGVTYDPNTIQVDELGDLPIWVSAT
jgi:hypothetical protein